MTTQRTGLRFQVSISNKPEAPKIEAAPAPASEVSLHEPAHDVLERKPPTRIQFPRPDARLVACRARSRPAEPLLPARRLSSTCAGPLRAAPLRIERVRVRRRAPERLSQSSPLSRDQLFSVIGPALKEASRLVEWSAVTMGVGSLLFEHPFAFASALKISGRFEGRLVSNAKWLKSPLLSVQHDVDIESKPMNDLLTIGGRFQLDGARVLKIVAPIIAGAQGGWHIGEHLETWGEEAQVRRVARNVAREVEAHRLSDAPMPRAAPSWKIALYRGLGALLSKLGKTVMLVGLEAEGLRSALDKKRLDLQLSRSVRFPAGDEPARVPLLLGLSAELEAEGSVVLETSLASQRHPEGLAQISERGGFRKGAMLGLVLHMIGRVLAHRGRGLAIARSELERLAVDSGAPPSASRPTEV